MVLRMKGETGGQIAIIRYKINEQNNYYGALRRFGNHQHSKKDRMGEFYKTSNIGLGVWCLPRQVQGHESNPQEKQKLQYKPEASILLLSKSL